MIALVPPRSSLLFDLYTAGQLANELIATEFEPRSLKVGAHSLLLLLAGSGPLTPTQLERETGLRPSTLRERMQPLFDGELVRRLASTEDRRSHTLEVTERGWEVLEEARPAVEAAESALQEQLGGRLEDFRVPLEQLLRAGQEALVEKRAESAVD